MDLAVLIYDNNIISQEDLLEAYQRTGWGEEVVLASDEGSRGRLPGVAATTMCPVHVRAAKMAPYPGCNLETDQLYAGVIEYAQSEHIQDMIERILDHQDMYDRVFVYHAKSDEMEWIV